MNKPRKRRNRANRGNKEKPPLAVQGVLRLEKSFIVPTNSEADEINIRRSDNAKLETIRLIPGSSEHDLVKYKAGYEVGPYNPLPQNETEAKIFEAERLAKASNESFNALKNKSEAERKQLQEKFAAVITLPQSITTEAAFHNDQPLEFGKPLTTNSVGQEELSDKLETEKKHGQDESVREMAVAVAIEMHSEIKRQARNRIIDTNSSDGSICALADILEFGGGGSGVNVMGPHISDKEMVAVTQEAENYDVTQALQKYWQFVDENPRDFIGWTYLIEYTEAINNAIEVRRAYNAFLPLFPNCFAYWIRYSEMEKKLNNWQRALAILHRGLQAIPLSVDLWIAYLNLYLSMFENHNNFDTLFRIECENAVATVGLEYRSDTLWESFIEWEIGRGNLLFVTDIYRRLIAIPTQLYNKHWDNFVAYVRDHQPKDILKHEEYETVRCATYKELNLRFRPQSVPEPNSASSSSVVELPDDKIKSGMKERIVASVLALHEACEVEVEKRIIFEDKIKRTYFHVKPLDQRQLKNWYAYLDYEISLGDHNRIIILFERCLISCAHYEAFWEKYAHYLEEASASIQDQERTKRPGEDINSGMPNEMSEVIENEMSGVVKTVWTNEGSTAVRDVYRRASQVHCSKSVRIKLQWAAFEEGQGNLEEAKRILDMVKKQYPLLLECSMQLIDLERRANNLDGADEMYKKLLKQIPQNRKDVKTWVAMKYARFLFKVRGQPDLALGTLRSALKKERGNSKLYTQIIDLCYQRHPIDVSGVSAAIELALVSGELSNLQKLEFIKRKIEFTREFGPLDMHRKACIQLLSFRKSCSAELKLEAKRKKEAQKVKLKEEEIADIRARIRADVNIKAKIADQEGKLLCTKCRTDIYPDAKGNYEFETYKRKSAPSVPAAPVQTQDDEIVDLLDMVIDDKEEEIIKKNLEEKTKYKKVAPTWELNIETYAGGKRRKVYDPDYEHVESAKFQEYERLETDGYQDEIKDVDRQRIITAPGLGLTNGGEGKPFESYMLSDYIVPPKVPQLEMGRPPDSIAAAAASTPDHPNAFELPHEISDPKNSPCVNVPEWFIKEGGQLCLSDTSNGMSIIRYWPKFLSEKGNSLMFNRIRKYCRWHQKQVQIDAGEWKYETRLVAWYGPCDYTYNGLNLEKNSNWAPELLDLLHRLISITKFDFNSCFLNLYRHGHDMCGWHADIHPLLGRNPSIASVSLGAVRVFEFRKKTGPPNFIRFPLFPGSLLLMEGATQEDWLHCLPRDISCKTERINLTFRTMFSMNNRR